MAEHTAGPWKAELHGSGSFTILAPNAKGGTCKGIIASRNVWSVRKEESHANAILIAAAPELLIALRNLTASCYDIDTKAITRPTMDTIDNAMMALLKAGGN